MICFTQVSTGNAAVSLSPNSIMQFATFGPTPWKASSSSLFAGQPSRRYLSAAAFMYAHL